MIRTEPLTENNAGGQNAVEFEDYLPKLEQVTFAHGENEQTVSILLVNDRIPQIENKTVGKGDDLEEDDGEGEHGDVIFKVRLEKAEPQSVKISKKNVCLVTIVQSEDVQKEADEHTKLVEYFMQSKEPSWGQQFKNACMLGPQIDEDNLILDEVSGSEAFGHFLTIFWKFIFAIVPPARYGGGVPAFVVGISFIGGVTAIVGEVASLLGCVLGIKDSVTAITFVALGTSLPDTFASMTAAKTSEHADSAVGNITGSNSVNVFLGLGLPWVIAATYNAGLDQKYVTPAGSLAFSVTLFLITSLTCFMVLAIRRKLIGGELGGPTTSKYLSAAFLVFLWFIYVVFSSLKAYEVIEGF